MVFSLLLLWIPVSVAAATFSESGRVFDGRAILNMGKGNNMCAITFDDGPGPHTARLLDILGERGIRATFFVVGSQIERRPQLIRRMLAEGHEVKNHTLSHGNLRHMPEEKQREEIVGVHNMLRELGGMPRLIRPPYGRFDDTTVEIAGEEGTDLVLWSVDSMDWMHGASIRNMRTQISGQKLRGIFLFHDTHVQTVDAMPEILDWLAADGCQFVTVAEFVREAEKLAAERAAAEAESSLPPGTEDSLPAAGLSGAGQPGLSGGSPSKAAAKEDAGSRPLRAAGQEDAVPPPSPEPFGDGTSGSDDAEVGEDPDAIPGQRSDRNAGNAVGKGIGVPAPGDVLLEYRHPLTKGPGRSGQLPAGQGALPAAAGAM